MDHIYLIPFIYQTINDEPIILVDGNPLGEWTWTYNFNELVVEGSFTVEKRQTLFID